MADVQTLGRNAWRNFVTDGVPSSGVHNPSKSDIRAFVDEVQESYGSLDARWFGVSPDTSVDSSVALNDALEASAASGKPVRLPATMAIGAPVTVPGGAVLLGAPGKTQITALAGSYNMFTLSGNDIVIEDLSINSAARTSGWEFVIACGTTFKNRLQITNIVTTRSFGLITDSGSGDGMHITVRLGEIQAKEHRGPGVQFTRAFAFQFWRNVAIDFFGSASPNFVGFSLDGTGLGAGGAILSECSVGGTAGVATAPLQNGYAITNFSDIWFDNTLADTCDGRGYLLTNVVKPQFSKAAASLCNNHGLELVGCVGGGGSFSVYGRKGLSGAASSIDGIRFTSGCYSIVLDGVVARDCTGNGLNKAAAQAAGNIVRGLVAASNVGYGVSLSGTSGFSVDGQLVGNAAGDYNITDNLDVNIVTAQIDSGVYKFSYGISVDGTITGPTFAPGNDVPSTFYTGNTANASWPLKLQSIYDETAVDMYLLFGGTLGSLATRAAPTITGNFDSSGWRRDYASRQTLLLAAAQGANGTPTYPFGVTDAGVVNALDSYNVGGTKVLGERDAGWMPMTGTANKATAYDTATVTLSQLAGRVMALQAALAAHGLIGS